MSLLAACLGVLIAASGCVVSVDYDNTVFLCADLSCPDGFRCQSGVCVSDDTPLPLGTFRRRLDLVDNGPDELTGFPLLVQLDDTRIDYAAAGAGGATIRFTDLDGTLLPHEVDTWDETGTSMVWVRVPRVVPASSEDALFLYWGATDPPAPPDPEAVWDETFVGVWHLGDDPAGGAVGAIVDATSTGLDGTSNTAMTAGNVAPGPIGDALHFSVSSGDAITVDDRPELELPLYSWSMWLRGDTLPGGGMGNGQPIFNADDHFNFSWNHSDLAFAQAASHRDSGGPLPAQITSPLVADQWYFIAATYNGSVLTVFLNGQAEGTVLIGTPVLRDGPLGIGNDPNGVAFSGFVDDVHIANTPRSPSWMASMYAAGIDSDTLRMIELGDIEPL